MSGTRQHVDKRPRKLEVWIPIFKIHRGQLRTSASSSSHLAILVTRSFGKCFEDWLSGLLGLLDSIDRAVYGAGHGQPVVRIEGGIGAVAGAGRADAAARGVHRDAPGRRRGDEAQAGGAAQHRHRSGRPRAGGVRVRPSGGASTRTVTGIWRTSRSTVRSWCTAIRRTCTARASPGGATGTTTPTPTTRRCSGCSRGCRAR